MKYKLNNGRIVEEGDYVQVKLTPRMIEYFKKLGVLFPYKEEDYNFIDKLFSIFIK